MTGCGAGGMVRRGGMHDARFPERRRLVGPGHRRYEHCASRAGIWPTRPAASASACTGRTTPRTRRTGCAGSRCSARWCRTLPSAWTSRCRTIRSRASSGVTTRPSPSTTTPTGWSPGAARRPRSPRWPRCRWTCGPRPRTTACTGSGSTGASPARRRSSSGSGSSRRRSGPPRTTRRSRGCRAGSARRSSGSRPRAAGPGWGLRGAFYEFTWKTGLAALAAARDAGADVQLVVHGRDRDPAGKDSDTPPRTTTPRSPRPGSTTWSPGVPRRTRARCSTTSSWC